MTETPVPRRRWFQFRLVTFLLLTAIAALSVGWFTAARRLMETRETNEQLRAENAKLRAETGYLEVNDPRQVHVLRQRELDDFTWRWRVWLPKGKWCLGGKSTQIAPNAETDSGSVGPFDGDREIVVTATVRKDAAGEWRFRAEAAGATIGQAVTAEHHLIAAAPMTSQSVDIAGDKLPQTFAPEKPVVLLRLIADEIVTGPNGLPQSRRDPKSNDGILVWIGPVGP